jgi:hypothetical protein
MKFPLIILALGVLILGGCSDSDSNSVSDAAGAMGRSNAKAVGTIDLTSIDKAIQLFNVNEGRFPKDLDELVQSKLIGKIPDAPVGMKIAYDASTGKVSLVPQ